MVGDGHGPSPNLPVAQLWVRAAHDLAQPVQAALLLARGMSLVGSEAEFRAMAGHMEATLESLQDMLDLMGVFSRIEAGVQVPALHSCQLADVLTPVIGEITEACGARGIKLRWRKVQGLVRSNPKLLAVMVRSMFLIAIKLAEGGEIVTRIRRAHGRLAVEVRFTGAPVDAARDRNAFVQLSPKGNEPACGLLGPGPTLLECLCHRLEHSLTYMPLQERGQLLTLTVPLTQ